MSEMVLKINRWLRNAGAPTFGDLEHLDPKIISPQMVSESLTQFDVDDLKTPQTSEGFQHLSIKSGDLSGNSVAQNRNMYCQQNSPEKNKRKEIQISFGREAKNADRNDNPDLRSPDPRTELSTIKEESQSLHLLESAVNDKEQMLKDKLDEIESLREKLQAAEARLQSFSSSESTALSTPHLKTCCSVEAVVLEIESGPEQKGDSQIQDSLDSMCFQRVSMFSEITNLGQEAEKRGGRPSGVRRSNSIKLNFSKQD